MLIPLPLRITAAIGVAAFGAATAGPAGSTPNAVRNCGTRTVAGKSWQVIVNNLPCATGWTILRRLAAQAAPPTGFAGMHAGMKCVGGPIGRKPTRIGCAGAGKALTAAVKGR